MRTVRVRIELTRAGAPAPAKRLRLGYRRTGVRQTYAWTPARRRAARRRVRRHAAGVRRRRPPHAPDREGLRPQPADRARAAARRPVGRRRLPGPGRVLVRRRGRPLRRAARRPHPPGPGHHRRRGHAARRAGRRRTCPGSTFQPGGAGHYVVLRGADGTDYVFMHLRKGSITAAKGVVAGRRPAVRPGRQHRRPRRARTCTSRSGPTAGIRRRIRRRSTRSRSSWRGRARASLFALGEIAQLVEHTTENRGVPGSSPGLAIGNGPGNQCLFAGARHDGANGTKSPVQALSPF